MTTAAENVSFKEGDQRNFKQNESLLDVLTNEDYNWSEVIASQRGEDQCSALDMFPNADDLLRGFNENAETANPNNGDAHEGNPEAINPNSAPRDPDDPDAAGEINHRLGPTRSDLSAWGQERSAELQDALLRGDLDALTSFMDKNNNGYALDTIMRDLNQRLERAGSTLRIQQHGEDRISIMLANGQGHAVEIPFGGGQASVRDVYAHRHGSVQYGDTVDKDPRALLQKLAREGRWSILNDSTWRVS
jgi:hypothetical protein